MLLKTTKIKSTLSYVSKDNNKPKTFYMSDLSLSLGAVISPHTVRRKVQVSRKYFNSQKTCRTVICNNTILNNKHTGKIPYSTYLWRLSKVSSLTMVRVENNELDMVGISLYFDRNMEKRVTTELTQKETIDQTILFKNAFINLIVISRLVVGDPLFEQYYNYYYELFIKHFGWDRYMDTYFLPNRTVNLVKPTYEEYEILKALISNPHPKDVELNSNFMVMGFLIFHFSSSWGASLEEDKIISPILINPMDEEGISWYFDETLKKTYDAITIDGKGYMYTSELQIKIFFNDEYTIKKFKDMDERDMIVIKPGDKTI